MGRVGQEEKLLILKHITETPEQKNLARKTSWSIGKVNYVIKALVEKGLIKAERFINSNNKAAYRYILTPSGIQERINLTKTFIEIKKREYEELVLELKKLEKPSQKESDES